jgi:hypothetical protein
MTRKEAHEFLQAKVEALKAELPGISFGYIGNYEYGQDYTQWSIFLPHYDRVGTYGDQVSLGAGRNDETFTNAAANWDKIEARIRQQYAAVPNRIGKAYFKKYDEAQLGLIVDGSGKALSLGINPPPRFESAEKAAEYLRHYNYPAVLVGA